MFTSRCAVGAVLLALAGCARAANTVELGEPVESAEIARWDISIPPSGEGLPKGGGTARQGAPIYQAKCQSCHGEKGAGELADPLAGGRGTLASKAPLRTVGSYWPYATTLFDYVRRAMPLANPLSLTNDEVYAVSAYVLYLNGIIGEDVAMNAQTLPRIKMPNREGFISDWPPR